MTNLQHLLKVTAWWTSTVYAICFFGVLLFPSIRETFMLYALHTRADLGENIMTLGTFLSGLVIWNIVALLAVWLFVFFYNTAKK